MNTYSSEQPTQIAIKSARAVVPGYGSAGQRFGSLVPTREIVAGIRPRRKPKLSASSPSRESHPADLPDCWLEKLLGIESIATTHVTQLAVNEVIGSGLDWSEASNRVRHPTSNSDVDAMTTDAIGFVLREYEQQCRNADASSRAIAGHIHISATSCLRTPYALLEARQATGCHKPGLPIVNLLSGCSGLLFALQHARFLLTQTEARNDDDAFVLISCNNDLLPFAHTRGRCPAERNENIDDWLFQAIFGEAAGAIVVGHANRERNDWVIEDVGWQAVTDDWRVTMTSESGSPGMVIRAREVSTTFRQFVPLAAKRGLEALGMSSFRDLHRLCLHESNPNLVANVVSRLEAPSERVHSISAKVGTLAGVSAFSLLDEALQAGRDRNGDVRDAIVCALIGESGNSVVAGHLAMRRSAN